MIAFYDGTMSIVQRLELARHLRNCEQCRNRQAARGYPIPTDPGAPKEIFYEPVSPTIQPANRVFGPDSHFGPYKIIKVIGRGGMGQVFEALHEALDRRVALKLLFGPTAHDPQFLTRFRLEAKAVGKLNHPNIVSPMDAGTIAGTPYLAMEYLDGIDLAHLIQQLGPIDLPNALDIVYQASLALHHLHEHNLVHRDIKPSNIFLTRRGIVKILDLGLALTSQKPESQVEQNVMENSVIGTFDYMAPEQWSDPSHVDTRADLYSLACVLYHLLCGKAPFVGTRNNRPTLQLKSIFQEPIPRIRLLRKDVPQEIEQLYLQLMSRKPDDRPSALEVANMVKKYTPSSHLVQLIARCQGEPVNLFTDDNPTFTAAQNLADERTTLYPRHEQQERSPIIKEERDPKTTYAPSTREALARRVREEIEPLLQAGHLNQAETELQKLAEEHSPEAHLRLAEVAMVRGEAELLLAHLKQLKIDDPTWQAYTRYLRRLCRSLEQRRRLRRHPAQPTAPAHMLLRWRLIRELNQPNTRSLERWVDRADQRSPEIHGFVDGREFHSVRDQDDRFASVLEYYSEGRYLWVPFEQVRQLTLASPDQWWHHALRPASLTLNEGEPQSITLPLVYPHKNPMDESQMLGYEFDLSNSRNVVIGIGGKTWFIGEEELMLKDCQQFEFF